MIKNICIILILLLVCFPSTVFAELIIITHGETKTDTLNKSTVKSIFLGNRVEWEDGKKITLMVLKKGDIHKEFLLKCVHKNPFQFTNYWKRQMFLGKVPSLPKSCNSIKDIVKFVGNTPGSIGYVSSDTDIADENIKKLCVIH